MRKPVTLSFLFVLIVCFSSCGSGGDKKVDTTPKDITKDPAYQKGFTLVANNKTCLTCHQIDGPFTGPSYREVANKYATYPDTIVAHLAHRIIQGGTGEWGTNFMVPHPDISQEDAEAMVRYILLLKK